MKQANWKARWTVNSSKVKLKVKGAKTWLVIVNKYIATRSSKQVCEIWAEEVHQQMTRIIMPVSTLLQERPQSRRLDKPSTISSRSSPIIRIFQNTTTGNPSLRMAEVLELWQVAKEVRIKAQMKHHETLLTKEALMHHLLVMWRVFRRQRINFVKT